MNRIDKKQRDRARRDAREEINVPNRNAGKGYKVSLEADLAAEARKAELRKLAAPSTIAPGRLAALADKWGAKLKPNR